MKLTFMSAPSPNLSATVAFYRDTLGWTEAWRESDDKVAFAIPNTAVQLMVSTTDPAVNTFYVFDQSGA
jgi:catechol 2,3-dioxygenase-like lactoylglutathione lyase family enzyme